MKELHFTRTGRMHVAYEGNRMFTLYADRNRGAETFVAEVYKRNGSGKRQLAVDIFATRAAAIDWLARHRVAA